MYNNQGGLNFQEVAGFVFVISTDCGKHEMSSGLKQRFQRRSNEILLRRLFHVGNASSAPSLAREFYIKKNGIHFDVFMLRSRDWTVLVARFFVLR